MLRSALAVAIALSATSVLAEQFGAIAYSIDDDRYGRAWNYSSREAAEAGALGYCADAGGENCEIAVWVQDSCGAAARAEGTNRLSQMGVSYGFKTAEASLPRAVSECEARNDGPCSAVASVCAWKQ